MAETLDIQAPPTQQPIQQPPQQQPTPQPPNSEELQKLYTSVSSHFDVGSFNQFAAKMQTPDDRQKFFNVISKQGADLGDYQTFENRLGSVEKKSPIGTTSHPTSQTGTTNTANGTQTSTPSEQPLSSTPSSRNAFEDALNKYDADKNITNAPIDYDPGMRNPINTHADFIKKQQPDAIVPVTPQTPQGIDWSKVKSNKEVHQKITDDAINNTAIAKLKSEGIDPAVQPDKLNFEKRFYKDQVDNGDATPALDANGNSGLKKVVGISEAFSTAYDKSKTESQDADLFVNNMNTQQKIDYLKTQQANNPNPEYIGKNENGWGATIGNLVGSNLNFLGKAGAGTATAGALIYASPETLGQSLTGLPAALSFAFTAPDAANQGAKNEIIRRYTQLKHDNPNMPDTDAMNQAESGKWSGGVAGLATNALLMGDAPAENLLEKPLTSEGKNVIANTIGESVKSGGKMGLITGGVTAAKELEGKAEGVNTSLSQIGEDAGKDALSNATVGAVLHTLTSAIMGGLKTATSEPVINALKYALVTGSPLEGINSTLKLNEKVGNIPQGSADAITNDLQSYKESVDKIPENVPADKKAQIADLIQQKQALIDEQKAKDNTFKEHYQKQIDDIDGKIKDIVETKSDIPTPLSQPVEGLDNQGVPIISSPKIETNEEASNNASAETNGQEVVNKGAGIPKEDAAPSIAFKELQDEYNGKVKSLKDNGATDEEAKSIAWRETNKSDKESATALFHQNSEGLNINDASKKAKETIKDNPDFNPFESQSKESSTVPLSEDNYEIPSDKDISKSLRYLHVEDGKDEFSDVNAAKELLTKILGARDTGASSYSRRNINGKILTIRISDHEGYQPDVYINHPDQANIPKTDNMIDIVLDKEKRDNPDEDDFLASNNKYQRIHVSVPEFEDENHAKNFIKKVINRINEDEEFALKEKSKSSLPLNKEGETTKETPLSKDIQPTEAFRTLNYGEHKGEPESKEAQTKIKQDILNDKPLGKTGEKFSDFVKRVIPAFKDILDKEENNTAVVTHSSVIKALEVWDEMGKPDIDKLTPEQTKEFAQKYVAEKIAPEGSVTTIKGEDGKEVHILRHGETEDNKLSEFRNNDTQLTDKGEAQAKKAGQELKQVTGGDVPKIITSDLPRTIHTSNIIHGELNPTNEVNSETNTENKQGEQSAEETQQLKPAVDENTQSTEEGDKNTGIKKAITLEERGQRKLSPIALKKLGTDSEVLQKGKEDVDSGKINPRDVVNRVIKENGIYSPDEAGAMQYYAHQLAGEEHSIRDEISNAPKDSDERLNGVDKLQQLSDEVDDFTKANRINSRSWGQLGNVMQIESDQSFSPSLNRTVIKENYGGEIPKDVQSKLDEALKMRDLAIEELKKAKEDAAAKSIKNDATLEQRQAKRKVTKEELKKERDDLLNELKKKDDSAPFQNSTSPLTDKQVHILGKLAINYFRDGVVTIEGLADKIYNDVKDKIGGVTKAHIKDAISNYPALKEVAKQKEIDRLSRKEKDVNTQLETGKLKEQSKPSDIVFKKTNDMIKAEQRIAKAEFQIKKLKQESFESKKNMYQKALGWAGRLVRLSVLSGTNVLYKLSSAAVIGGAIKRIPEQALGGMYSQIFKSIADKAPIEGYLNAKSEAQFYKEFFNPKKFADNAGQILKTGESRLSQKFNPDAHEHIPLLYLPTDLHQIIKDPLKRGAYEASFRNAMINAEKHGYDINDPLVVNSIENAAYKRANYEIFQESNALSRKFGQWKNEMEKNGNVGATGKFVADFLIPVSTVPTNIARRLGITSPLGLIKASADVINAYRKGIENIKPEEADQVMRQLKQGSLGTALWLTGWFGYKSLGGLYTSFNPNKKRMDDLKSDQMLVDGKMIPKPVQHALPIEITQLAATARRIWEERSEKKNNTFERIAHTGLATIGAATSDIPIISTGTHLVEATQNPQGAKKLGEDMKSRFEPTILKETGVIKPDKKK